MSLQSAGNMTKVKSVWLSEYPKTSQREFNSFWGAVAIQISYLFSELETVTRALLFMIILQ